MFSVKKYELIKNLVIILEPFEAVTWQASSGSQILTHMQYLFSPFDLAATTSWLDITGYL